MTIASRIEERFSELKKKDGIKRSWSRMAIDLGFTAQASTRWKNDIISVDTLQKIAEYTHSNLAWLLTGEGNPNKSTNLKSEGIKEDNHFSKSLEDKNNVQGPLQGQGKRIPIISYVEAGALGQVYELDSTSEYVVSFNEDLSDECFALIVKGLSMYPDFNPGDTIIVDKKVVPIPGDCVVAQNDDHEATFKKYKPRGYTDTGVEIFDLEPINQDYPTLRSNVQNIRIIGTVIEHHKKLRKR